MISVYYNHDCVLKAWFRCTITMNLKHIKISLTSNFKSKCTILWTILSILYNFEPTFNLWGENVGNKYKSVVSTKRPTDNVQFVKNSLVHTRILLGINLLTLGRSHSNVTHVTKVLPEKIIWLRNEILYHLWPFDITAWDPWTVRVSLPASVLVFLVQNSDCESDRLTNLKQHIRYHDKKKEYCCTICSSEFTRPDDFRKHLINFHNIHVSATLLKSSYHYPWLTPSSLNSWPMYTDEIPVTGHRSGRYN